MFCACQYEGEDIERMTLGNKAIGKGKRKRERERHREGFILLEKHVCYLTSAIGPTAAVLALIEEVESCVVSISSPGINR